MILSSRKIASSLSRHETVGPSQETHQTLPLEHVRHLHEEGIALLRPLAKLRAPALQCKLDLAEGRFVSPNEHDLEVFAVDHRRRYGGSERQSTGAHHRRRSMRWWLLWPARRGWVPAEADPNLLRKDGHTPFSVAVVTGNLQVIREMVARGADLTADYNPHDNFPDPVESIMHIAAGNLSPPEIVEHLHALGVPLGSKNSMGETPLDLADHQERHREAARTQKLEALSDPESLRRTAEQRTQTTDAIKKFLASH